LNDQTPPTPDTDMISRLGLNTRLARFSRKQIAIAAGGALAFIIVLFFVFGGSKPEQYVTAELTRGPLSITVSATGTLAPRDQVDVGSEVSGRIDALYADYNDRVAKGQ
jgi:HlyD family secretion protein